MHPVLVLVADVRRDMQYTDLQAPGPFGSGRQRESIVAVPPNHVVGVVGVEEPVQTCIQTQLPRSLLRPSGIDANQSESAARGQASPTRRRGRDAFLRVKAGQHGVRGPVRIGDVNREGISRGEERDDCS